MYEQFRFDLARNSLRYLIKRFDIKEIYIPYYLCDVIRHAVISDGCTPVFYHIDDSFFPVGEFPKDSYILYPNYFGICNNNVSELEKIYPKLIIDNAHAFYLHPQGFACFNSERKFCDVKNGSYLWIKNEQSQDNLAEKQPNRPMNIIQKRRDRFKELAEKYGKTNSLKIDISSVTSPFCYPYLASEEEEADKLAETLAKEGLTIYRYWNNLPKNYNEYKFYRRLVPIPIQTSTAN